MEATVMLLGLKVVGEFAFGVDGDRVASAPYEFALDPRKLNAETLAALVEDLAGAREKAREALEQMKAQLAERQEQETAPQRLTEVEPGSLLPCDGKLPALAGVEG